MLAQGWGKQALPLANNQGIKVPPAAPSRSGTGSGVVWTAGIWLHKGWERLLSQGLTGGPFCWQPPPCVSTGAKAFPQTLINKVKPEPTLWHSLLARHSPAPEPSMLPQCPPCLCLQLQTGHNLTDSSGCCLRLPNMMIYPTCSWNVLSQQGAGGCAEGILLQGRLHHPSIAE